MGAAARRTSQITVGALVVAILAPGLAQARPSVRSDARTVRYADPDVRGASQRLTGTLVEVADGPDRYLVEARGGTLRPLDFGGVALPERVRDAPVEAEVTADGTVGSATVTPRAGRAGRAASPAAHAAYVAKVDIAGKGTVPTDGEVQAMVDTWTTRWVQESNGAITSFPRAGYAVFTPSACSSGSALWNEAAGLFPGVSFGGSTRNHLIVVGAPDCAGGLGTVGGSGLGSGGRLNMNWSPQKNPNTLMHELGHNFSLEHANACDPAGMTCTFDEYGNRYAFMGVSVLSTPAFTPSTLDGFERARLDILDPGELTDVALAPGQRTFDGVYDLRARGFSAGLRGLRITDPITGNVQYVDWRSGGGRDAASYYGTRDASSRFRAGVTLETAETASSVSETLQGQVRPGVAPDGIAYSLLAGESATAGALTLTVVSTGDKNDPLATSRIGVRLSDPSVPPDTSITAGPDEGATVTQSSVALAFTGTPADAVAGFDCALDGAPWTACASPVSFPGLADGPHAFAVRARDGAGLTDASPATRSFTVATSPPPAPVPTPTPAAAELTRPAVVLEPAKLEVARATITRSTRRLSVLAPITGRASGVVQVVLRAGGRTSRFTTRIDARDRRVVIDRRISAAQARLASGILELTYPGDADTQPQTVRVRAASGRALLRAGRPTISAGRLRAAGTISPRARGVVRLQVLYEPASGGTRVLRYKATISRGRYRVDTRLPAAIAAEVAARRGVVHSYTLFTGDLGRRIRGELASYGVLGRP